MLETLQMVWSEIHLLAIAFLPLAKILSCLCWPQEFLGLWLAELQSMSPFSHVLLRMLL